MISTGPSALPDPPLSSEFLQPRFIPDGNESSHGLVSGRIVDPFGVPVTGARVTLTSESPGPAQTLLSGDDGQFSFSNAAPGPFQLTIVSAGFADQKFSGVLHSAQNFTVPPIVLALASVVTEVRVTPSIAEVAQEQIKQQEKQRALGLVPNFYVTYVHDAAPLTPRQKYELAWKSIIDPVDFGIIGVVAGIQQQQNNYSAFGQGAQGYAKRYGAAFATGSLDTVIGSAILPSLLKQDPRYFYKGTGSKRSRLIYAVANSVICKGDNGRWQPNYSAVLGGLAAGGISNLYYPAKDRNGVGLTFENALLGTAATAVTNILQEFLIRKLTPNVPNPDPGVSSTRSTNPIARLFGAFMRDGD
ncbi:MAG: carboxypeptidase-like regulatory domain-containing protein [Acidobacteriota bacterium]|nr:carboxypeptidase-like regulatory domain-containing protein [Acidobacteriota bacterium]